MKIKKEYVLKTIGDEMIIVPIKDEAIRFNGIITVNKTAAYLFDLLQKNDLSIEKLVEAVMNKYEVEEEIAKRDVKRFISKCKDSGLLDE